MLPTSRAHAAAVELFSETFESIVFPVPLVDLRIGVPRTDGSTLPGISDSIGNSDENWFGARFESPGDTDAPAHSDVGALDPGSTVGWFKKDAGLIAQVDTTNYRNIKVTFDWRTALALPTDRFVFGYFAGNLQSLITPPATDPFSFDLRDAANGGANGAWNWGGNWVELMRVGPSNTFTQAMFHLPAAVENGQFWLGFWLDGELEIGLGKIDNIVVTGTLIPIPPALLLLLSGLGGLALLRRRITARTSP